MWRPPRTVKAAFLAGFLVIFTVWLLSTYYVTGRLTASQERSAAIHARFLRGQELLFTISQQALLGSLYLRDALIEGTDASVAAAHGQLRDLQTQVDRELRQYESIDSTIEAASWRRLEEELRHYWETMARLTAPASAGQAGTASTLLRTEVIPKRDVITRIADEIRQVMADDYSRENRELVEVHEQLRRRLWETTAVAVILGCAAVFLATWYAAGLESQILKDRRRGREEPDGSAAPVGKARARP